MATITNFGTGHEHGLAKHKPLPPDPSCQPCPDCGGLECLCRPRFFAGQLLSEQDLNRLDHYIVEKHKLHNRHLFGSGVVCGLEVKCAPCDSGFVTVAPGYALSPCGEDIVVCKQDMVDICALIARCRTDTEPDCAPYRGQDSCGEVIEDWILSIRYAESPSRGITPLTGAGQSCGCSCAGPCSGKCGGGSTCGCGGGPACSCGAAKGLAEPEPLRQPRLNRGSPPSCEPTLTCETYRYDVFRKPEEEDDPRGELTGIAGIFGNLEGEMMANITCCLKELEKALPKPPGDLSAPIADADKMKWFQWGCQLRTAIANYFVRVGGHDCQAIAKIQAIVIPSPNQPASAFQAALQQAEIQFAILVFEAMIACFCSNALPPCPAPGDPRVPLALVRVRKGDCTVISVCNWTPLRRHVLTFPTLEYWFGWIPIARFLREIMHLICCDLFGLKELFDQPQQDTDTPVFDAAAAGQPTPPPPGANGTVPTANAAFFSFETAVGIDPAASFRANTDLFRAVMARHAMGGEGGTVPTLGDIARTVLERPSLSLGANLDFNERKAAILRAAVTPPVGVLAGMFASAAPPAAAMAGALGLRSSPNPEIAELKAVVSQQQKDIAALKRKVMPAEEAAPAAAPARGGTKRTGRRRGKSK